MSLLAQAGLFAITHLAHGLSREITREDQGGLYRETGWKRKALHTKLRGGGMGLGVEKETKRE